MGLTRTVVYIGLVLGVLVGCRDDVSTLSGVQLRLVSFGSILPSAAFFEEHPIDSVQPSPLARGSLRYLLGPGDSLHVSIEEFHDPVAAYASWLNRGLGPARLPRIIGDQVQQSFWSGKWIFLFTSPSYRLPLPASMDQLVHSFPETGGSLPPQFLSLPLRERIVNGASVQLGSFWGEPFPSPILCQRYEDELGVWTAARSLREVTDREVANLLEGLKNKGFRGQGLPDGLTLLWDGNIRIVFGIVKGNMLVVWGRRDVAGLTYRWQEAHQTLLSE